MPKPNRLFFSLILYTLSYGNSARKVPQSKNLVPNSTTLASSSNDSIRPKFKLPKLHTSLSSADVTSVQALRRVSSSLSIKLKLNPGSADLSACLTLAVKTSPASPVFQ